MAKNKKEKRISGKGEVSLRKLGRELSSVQKGVKKHKLVRDNPNTRLLESETNLSKCDRCILRNQKSDQCIWLEENKCSDKCKGFKNSVYSFGAVDINKVKHALTTTDSEIQLQKKLKQYIPFAERIEQVFQEEEAAAEKERKRKLVEETMRELEEMEREREEDPFDNKPKRRNLKSLI